MVRPTEGPEFSPEAGKGLGRVRQGQVRGGTWAHVVSVDTDTWPGHCLFTRTTWSSPQFPREPQHQQGQ